MSHQQVLAPGVLLQDCQQESQREEGQGALGFPQVGRESPHVPRVQRHWEGDGLHPLALSEFHGTQHSLLQEQGCRHPQTGPRGFPAVGEAAARQVSLAQQPPARPFPLQRTPLSTHVPKAQGWQTPPLQDFLSVEQKAAPGQRWGIWEPEGTLLPKVLAGLRPPHLQQTTTEHLQLLLAAHLVTLAAEGCSHSGCLVQSQGPHWVPAPSSAHVQGGAEKQLPRWSCLWILHCCLEPLGPGWYQGKVPHSLSLLQAPLH